jgi:hypothetical protein
MNKAKKVSRLKKKKKKKTYVSVTAKQNDKSRQLKAAIKQVNDLVILLGKETCGKVEMEKTEDVF